jgi:hypothetical protein
MHWQPRPQAQPISSSSTLTRVELRGLEPLTASMPWWPDKLRRSAASRERVHGCACAAPFMQAGSPHSAPRTRALQGEIDAAISAPKLSSASIRTPQRPLSGVLSCAGQRPYVRSKLRMRNPICPETSSGQKCWYCANVFVKREGDRGWCEFHTHMQAARSQRERGSPHCAASPSGCVSQCRHRQPGPVAPHRLPSDLTSGWVESREPGEL